MKLQELRAAFQAADLYVVITEAFCAGRPAIEILRQVLDAGVRLVQLREKDLDDRALYEKASAFRKLTRDHDALLIVNDRVDIALAADADGVHLGQEDLPLQVTRQLAPDLIIGCSTHSLDEARAAQQAGATYVNIGPIFSTQTKSVQTGTLGPEAIQRISPHLCVPWTVMGGIKLGNVDLVIEKGARLVAVVTAVTAAEDVREAATRLRERILSFRGSSDR